MSLGVLLSAGAAAVAAVLALLGFARRDARRAERERAARAAADRLRRGMDAAAAARQDARTPEEIVRANDGDWR